MFEKDHLTYKYRRPYGVVPSFWFEVFYKLWGITSTIKVAGLGHGASIEPYSYAKEHSRPAARMHFTVSFRVSTASDHHRNFAAATTGSTMEPY